MKNFNEFVAIRDLMEEDQAPPGVDPEMWANPSYRKFWIAQHPEYAQQAQAQPQQAAPAPAARALNNNQAKQQLLQREMQRVDRAIELIGHGFDMGGRVPQGIIDTLGLNSINRSLVADSEQFAMGGAYPFFKDKRAGSYTGNIMYKKGYNVNNLRSVLQQLVKDRFKVA